MHVHMHACAHKPATLHTHALVPLLQHAARLAKADLATATVMEMTDLAGTMGRHYAQKQVWVETVHRSKHSVQEHMHALRH